MAPDPLRVYVSGFLDWPGDGESPVGFDPWRCRQNPSGYLFIGRWHEGGSKPDPTAGPLPKFLRRIDATSCGTPIEWTFDVLPTRWGVGEDIPHADHDVIVNLGLGVYPKDHGADHESIILLEEGATNGRSGRPDARGVSLEGAIDLGAARTLRAPTLMTDRLAGTAGTLETHDRVYEVRIAEARASNAFVCNETHYRMLEHVHGEGRLREAYFIHLPRPKNIRRGRPLATAVARVVGALLGA